MTYKVSMVEGAFDPLIRDMKRKWWKPWCIPGLIKDHLNYRRTRRIKIRGLNTGYWVEYDERILYGVFTLLVDYVHEDTRKYGYKKDVEKYLKFRHDSDPDAPEGLLDRHNHVCNEVEELYRWWVEERPKRQPATELFEGPHPGIEMVKGEPEEHGNGLKTIPLTFKTHPQYKQLLDKQYQQEREWSEEDETQLIRVMKIREALWV